MLMQLLQSGDKFGVSSNWEFVLLQTMEISDDSPQCRIKLTLEDVDRLIDDLNHYKNRVAKWKEAVGPQKDQETENEYKVRIWQTLQENNYFIPPQEA
jgi:hypothetical protein